MNGQHGVAPSPNGGPHQIDAIIIGAGFSGITALYRLRKIDLNAKIVEAASDFGGVWHWNRYPGARVDSEIPFYQLNIPEVYRTWNFRERYPSHLELREYISHLDRTLGLRKHVFSNSNVVKASYDSQTARWIVEASIGLTISAKYLILATGLLNRRYLPDFPDLDKYKGTIVHSGAWPNNPNCKGKKVAVIGGSATSIQIVQELAKQTADGGSLTAFIRRPSTCLPMHQRILRPEEQRDLKAYYPVLFDQGRKSHGGFPIAPSGMEIFQVTDRERERIFEDLWNRGGFSFLLGNFGNIMADLKANRVVYDFWAKKVRPRISDPYKRDIMAPLEPVYPICTKQPPLENDYYECLSMDHAKIVDLKSTTLKGFTENGIATEDGTSREFNVVIMATGFDSFTGSLTNLGLKNEHGVDVRDIWKDGVRTYLGLFMNGFPNAFLVYSPQAVKTANIPGKKAQVMSYAAGIGQYEATCKERLN